MGNWDRAQVLLGSSESIIKLKVTTHSYIVTTYVTLSPEQQLQHLTKLDCTLYTTSVANDYTSVAIHSVTYSTSILLTLLQLSQDTLPTWSHSLRSQNTMLHTVTAPH